jgi:hypothetical protein
MLEDEIRAAEADVQHATNRLEERLRGHRPEGETRGLGYGEAVAAAVIEQAGARIALALLRGAQALAQNAGDPRR